MARCAKCGVETDGYEFCYKCYSLMHSVVESNTYIYCVICKGRFNKSHRH